MNNLIKLMQIFASMTLSIDVFAFVGAVDGGGGRGIVCRNEADVIQRAETLDLYEGSVMYGINVQKSEEPMEEQIQSAILKIGQPTRGLVRYFVDQVMKYKRLTPPGTDLLPIDDSFEVVLPRDCKAEQLANYYNDQLILINGDIWYKLGETDKAALILHEAVYAMNRLVGAADSRRSRHVVANLFSTDTNFEAVKAGVPSSALNCASESMFMWAFKNADQSRWILQFQILGQAYVVSKKTLTVYNSHIDFNEAKNFPIFEGDDLIGSGTTTHGTLRSNYEENDIISISKKWEAIRTTDGQQIRGYQTPRYYFSWQSGTHPGLSIENKMINCSIQVGPDLNSQLQN